MTQAISEGLTRAGFSPEIRDLSFFQDDYGLKPIDGADDGDDDDDDDDDGEEEDRDDSDDVGGSEGYEIVEGHEVDLDAED